MSRTFYLLSVFITNIGNSMAFVSAGKIIYDSTGLASLLGAILVIEHFQGIFLNYIAGNLVDKVDAKRVAVFSDALLCITTFSIAVMAGYGKSDLFVPIGLFVANLIKPFYRVSTFALVRFIAKDEELFNLNTHAAAAFQLGHITGLAIGSILLMKMDPSFLLLLDAVSYLGSSILLSQCYIKQSLTNTTQHQEILLAKSLGKGILTYVIQDIISQVRLVINQSSIMYLIFLFSVHLAVIDAYNVCVFKMVSEVFPGKPEFLGVLEGCFFGASLLMTIVLSRTQVVKIQSIKIWKLFLVQAVLMVVLGCSRNIVLHSITVALWGSISPLVLAFSATNLQIVTPTSHLGRVGAARNILVAIFSMLIVSITGAILDYLGLLLGYIFIAIFLVFAGIIALNNKNQNLTNNVENLV